MAAWASCAQGQGSQFPIYGEHVPVATLDRERLLSESAYGVSISTTFSQRQSALVAENERLLAELEQEERDLTEVRKTASAEDFALLARAFDDKANAIRDEQDAKAIALAKLLDSTRTRFFREVEPIIVEVMQEEGVLILLNEQAVMLNLGGADITARVLARLDQLYQDGKIGQTP